MKILPKTRDAIVRALRSGVVPRTGLQHIQVGRYNEIKSFLADIENVADGGTSFRLVIGEYGSGKTFFLSLVRAMAMEKGLVAMTADLSPTKRLHSREGRTRALLSELVGSMATRTRPDGGALPLILERLAETARRKAADEGIAATAALESLLAPLGEYPGGYAFARVVAIWCDAAEYGDTARMGEALRWLRCETANKTDAMRSLGLREFIGDDAFFNTIVLYSVLVRAAGYRGLYVCLDEMVNLYKIVNAVSRKANYEEILNILNNTLQGSVKGLGIVMSGTPEFLTDSSRGLYSYEALRSRLAENAFSRRLGLPDYNSTVLRLPSLTPEEMFLLLRNLRDVFALGRSEAWAVPDEALTAYLDHCSQRIGDAWFRTPRNTIKGFIDLLSVLAQYPDRRWQDLVPAIEVAEDRGDGGMPTSDTAGDAAPEAFAGFSL